MEHSLSYLNYLGRAGVRVSIIKYTDIEQAKLYYPGLARVLKNSIFCQIVSAF